MDIEVVAMRRGSFFLYLLSKSQKGKKKKKKKYGKSKAEEKPTCEMK